MRTSRDRFANPVGETTRIAAGVLFDAVIGMDGTALAYAFTPSITTMEIPVDDICKEAVHMLLKKISHGRSANQIRVFQTVLVENRSTNKDAPLRFELG